MSEELLKDDLDALLRRTMKDRPEGRASFDLAAVAMERARLAPLRTDATTEWSPLAAVSRVNWWNRIVTGAAAVMIVGITMMVVHNRLAAGGFQAWSDATGSSTVSTSTEGTGSIGADGSATSDTSTSSANEWMFIGVMMAVGAVVVIAGQRTLSATDEWMAAAWGRGVSTV